MLRNHSKVYGKGFIMIKVYTDGSCYPNPGSGGWAAVIVKDNDVEVLVGNHPDTTNNRMELTAAIEVLRYLEKFHRVKLYTDSQYLKRGITEWLPKWIIREWQTATGKAVKNQDLWQELYNQSQRHSIEWVWVRGHADNEFNIMADEAAVKAREGFW
jgi:ribonuclease HI